MCVEVDFLSESASLSLTLSPLVIQVRCELAPVVDRDCSDPLPVREQQPDDFPSRRYSFSPVSDPRHEDEARRAFREREHGVFIWGHNGAHMTEQRKIN